MKDLKTVLFEETRYHFRKYHRFKKEYGDWDDLVAVESAKFKTLYNLIIEAGLEDEYIEWRVKEGEE